MLSKYLEQDGCNWKYAGRKYVAYSYEPTVFSEDCNGGYRRIDLLSDGLTVDGVYDMALYDPPYKPSAVHDKRAKDYGIDVEVTYNDIVPFYRREVFEFLHRHTRMGVIVKGSDFSYPYTSEEVKLFLWDVFRRESVKGLFYPVAIYIYRFTNGNLPLYRYRIAKSLRRTITNHTYFIVLYRLCDGKPCQWKRLDYSERIRRLREAFKEIF